LQTAEIRATQRGHPDDTSWRQTVEFLSTFWGMLLVGWAPYLAFGGGVLYLGTRYVRAVERRGVSRAEIAGLTERLARLEEAVANVADDVGRVEEGQSFATRVLTERAADR
jgi:hypothetical protein